MTADLIRTVLIYLSHPRFNVYCSVCLLKKETSICNVCLPLPVGKTKNRVNDAPHRPDPPRCAVERAVDVDVFSHTPGRCPQLPEWSLRGGASAQGSCSGSPRGRSASWGCASQHVINLPPNKKDYCSSPEKHPLFSLNICCYYLRGTW
jgi:hypothetical protein